MSTALARYAETTLRQLLAAVYVSTDAKGHTWLEAILAGAQTDDDGFTDCTLIQVPQERRWTPLPAPRSLRGETAGSTKVNRCLAEGRARLRQLGAMS